MPFHAEPERYAPSGRCHLPRLLAILASLLPAALLLALIFEGLLLSGMYFLALSGMLAVGAASGFAHQATRYAHCRNRLLAGGLAALCGISGYLTYFHLDQCLRWQVPPSAIDRLPGYLAFRMETDSWNWQGKGAQLEPLPPQPNIQPLRPLANANLLTLNWAIFLFEAAALALAPLATAFAMASRPYSEKQRRWCVRESLFLSKHAGRALRAALAGGDIAAWVDAGPQRVAEHEPHCRLTLWYSPWDAGTEFDGEVFLSLDGGPTLRLSTEEGAAFITLLPGLQDIAGLATGSDPPGAGDSDPTVTRIWPVPARYAGPKQSPAERERSQCVRGLALGGQIGGTILLLIGGTMALERWIVGPGLLPTWVLPAYVAGVGFPAYFFISFRLAPDRIWRDHISNCHRLVCKMIASRPDPLVHADDPQAIYAEYLPRRAWESGQPNPNATSNEGLLRFDDERSTALFEAEHHRCCIPAASILTARIENMPGVSRTVEGLYAVVLRVRLASTVQELPLFPLGVPGIEGNWNRAVALLNRFELLCNRDLGDQPSVPPEPIEVPLSG